MDTKTYRERRLPARYVVLPSLLALFSGSVSAQTPPDAGSLLRREESTRPPVLPSQPLSAPVIEAMPKAAESIKVVVKGFRILHASLIPESELTPLLEKYIGREVSFGELRQAAAKIGEYYRSKGYLARAYLPRQEVKDGIVEIVVLEGRLGGLRIEPAHRATEALVRPYFDAKLGEALRLNALEHALLLINDIPGVSAVSYLEPGDHDGESIAVVRVEDRPVLVGQVQADNSGSKSTGRERLIANASLNDRFGFGDQFAAFGTHSVGNDYANFSASLPIGASGLRAGLQASALHYQLGNGFAALDASGSATTWGLTASYPFIRTPAANLSGSTSWDAKHFVNRALGAETSNKTTRPFSLGLSGNILDTKGGGGNTSGGMTLTNGQLDLAGSSGDLASDQLGPQRNGTYRKLAWSVSRLQRLPGNWSLWASATGQSASRNLDSSEKFALGGPTGVRAYAISEASGDEGWLVNLEARYAFNSAWQATAFVDSGEATLNRSPWAGWNAGNPGLPNRYRLSGAGVSLAWNGPSNLTLRTTAAWRLGNNPGLDANGKDSEGGNASNRIWLQAGWAF